MWILEARGSGGCISRAHFPRKISHLGTGSGRPKGVSVLEPRAAIASLAIGRELGGEQAELAQQSETVALRLSRTY